MRPTNAPATGGIGERPPAVLKFSWRVRGSVRTTQLWCYFARPISFCSARHQTAMGPGFGHQAWALALVKAKGINVIAAGLALLQHGRPTPQEGGGEARVALWRAMGMPGCRRCRVGWSWWCPCSRGFG